MSAASELHGRPHVERYLATDGEDGYHWRRGTTILILFTRVASPAPNGPTR